MANESDARKTRDDVKNGYYLILFSSLCLFEVICNGILGIFPGAIIGQGGLGQKFYFLPWLTQQLGSWNGQDFWSDAGFVSDQEFAFITLHIFLIYLGFAYLRRGNDPESDLRIQPDDWGWMGNYPNLKTVLTPIVMMWLFILASMSMWVFIVLVIVILLFLEIKFKSLTIFFSKLNEYLEETGTKQIQVAVPLFQPQNNNVPTHAPPTHAPPTHAPTTSESTQTISDSVAGGDVVGGDKVVNDPDTIAKVAIEAYRRGILESKED